MTRKPTEAQAREAIRKALDTTGWGETDENPHGIPSLVQDYAVHSLIPNDHSEEALKAAQRAVDLAWRDHFDISTLGA